MSMLRCCVSILSLVMTLGGLARVDEPLKTKDGPLGMKFVPLPKGMTYLGWNGKKDSAKKTEIKEEFEIAIHTVTQESVAGVAGQ